MLAWSFLFLISALIAGVVGFTQITRATLGIGKVFFYIFILLFFIASFAGGLFKKKH